MECSEFRNLVDAIEKKYLISQYEIANFLDISSLIFSEYYNGVRKIENELINKLKEIYKISYDDIEVVKKEKEKEKLLYKNINRLTKLNDEHKEKVFELINSYYKEETEIISKKLINNK